MATNIFICLAVVITPALCDLATYVYYPDCVPTFDQFPTTLAPGFTTPGYDLLKPIERCCPQCEKCKHLGGSCHLRWALEVYDDCLCDFTPIGPCRDYSCKCCITCQDDTCSDCAQNGGECRKTCRSFELEDKYNLCSYHNNGTGCKCCKKCESTFECSYAYGTCRTNPADCPWGTYPSTGCCGGCTCCKPVLTPVIGTRCANTPGSYCSESEDCADGYFACFGECASTQYTGGLSFKEVGFCCVPKNAASSTGRVAGKFHHGIGNKIQHNYDNLVAEQANKIHAQNRHPKQLMH